jgi:cob(I)alamin adenosyltransferase
VVQFLKGGIGQGHDRPVQLGQNLDWVRCNLPRCISAAAVGEEESQSLQSYGITPKMWCCGADMTWWCWMN